MTTKIDRRLTTPAMLEGEALQEALNTTLGRRHSSDGWVTVASINHHPATTLLIAQLIAAARADIAAEVTVYEDVLTIEPRIIVSFKVWRGRQVTVRDGLATDHARTVRDAIAGALAVADIDAKHAEYLRGVVERADARSSGVTNGTA